MKVLVESAVELESAQEKTLTAILEKEFGKNVEIDREVDPEILGGLRITVNGSKRYDLSLLGRLEYIKKVLN